MPKTETNPNPFGRGFSRHGQRFKVQVFLPRDIAEAIAAERDLTSEPPGSIVRRIVTKEIRSKPRQD